MKSIKAFFVGAVLLGCGTIGFMQPAVANVWQSLCYKNVCIHCSGDFCVRCDTSCKAI